MRVLLLCDDYYHPGEIPIRGVEPLRAKGITIDVIQNAEEFDPATLPDYAAVIMSKCDHTTKQNEDSWKTEVIQDAFVEYVEKGGGLLVTHSGTIIGKATAKLDKLIGCKFAFHPANCPVLVQPLKPHPVTNGAKGFWETDEHYNIEILANDIDIFLAAYAGPQGEEGKYETEPYFNNPGCIAPAGYVRTQGNGRVCVLTPGHIGEVWLNPQYQILLENAIRWCAGG